MKITQEVRDHAEEVEREMARKAEEFRQTGGEIYRPG
jgi:hypothetical protein